MIILEGPDGAGKTTLAAKMASELNLDIHPRFVSSAGPSNLNKVFHAVRDDTIRLIDQPIQIYDRHPLISEYVYGPMVRGEIYPDWCYSEARLLRSMLTRRCLVIWCLPSLKALRGNIDEERDMPGVVDNIDKINASYYVMRQFWSGPSFTYSYEDGRNSEASVMQFASTFITQETVRRQLVKGN